MQVLLLDFLFIIAFIFLIYRLFSFTPTQIGTFQQPYLTFVVVYTVLWFVGGMYLTGKTVVEFFPAARNAFIIYFGLLGLILSVPVKLKALNCEKKVARQIKSSFDIEPTFAPFYKSIVISRTTNTKESIEDLFKLMYCLGAWFIGAGLVGNLPFAFDANLLCDVVFAFLMYLIYRWQSIYIYKWLVKEKILKLSDLTTKQRYIVYILH